MTSVCPLELMELAQSCIVPTNCVSQDNPLRKPCWFWCRMSWLSRWDAIWLHTTCSMSLQSIHTTPLLTSVRLYQRPTWSRLYAGIQCYLLWTKDAGPTGQRLIQSYSGGRMLTTLSARYAMDWSEWICLDTYDSHIQPASVSGAALFRAARHGLHQNYMEKITWRRYIHSQRDVVTHTMSVCADLALSGTDDVLSSIRGARPARPYGWISHWHERPPRSSIAIMSSLLGQNSEVSWVSSALQSGHLFVPISTTHIREVGDEILPSAAVRFVRILPALLRVRDEIHQ